MVSEISYESIARLLNFIKHENDTHAPAALQKLPIGCLNFELSKIRFIRHNLFDGFLKYPNTMYNR